MALHGQKKEIKGDLTALKNRTVELKEILGDVREKIQIFKAVQMPQTHSLIERMRKQHLKMLETLEQLDDSEKLFVSSSVKSHDKSEEDESPTRIMDTPKLQNRQTSLIGPSMNTITPKRHQSPFVLRANPLTISKLSQQFRFKINATDFNAIPKYLKRRDSLDELSTFLETIIVKSFIDKNHLLHQNRENVQPALMLRWKMYRTQMEYFPGEMFITEGDISHLIGRMMDKKMQNRIAMLRHLQIIQDVRRGSCTCFLWKRKK